MCSFSIGYTKSVNISDYQFSLHTHDEYEIFMFLEGDAHYVVDGKYYSLEPHDIIIIRRNEMHRIFHHNLNTLYSRLVIMVEPEFFKINNCSEYERQFTEIHEGRGHKISADIVRSSGLHDAIMRLKKYTNDFNNINTAIAKATITEILHIINEVKLFTDDDTPNSQLRSIMTYVNSNYTSNITLEEIADKFFISKYYLCHMFKKATGLTLHKYITQKRISLAKTYISQGVNITSAVMDAGFNNYSSFYRAYTKEFGITPKEGMKL